ncbi:MAG: lipopolysaccharide heptosyltransferase I [Acidobacteria bacterium]|nr:lipopolysaccharide heptosyltransferase I [Acidobacteriota bacterium]
MSSPGTPIPKPERILILRFGALGDIVHALPAAAHLRHTVPGARIVWAVEPRWLPVLEGHPALDAIVPLPLKAWRKRPLSASTRGPLRQALAALRTENFDLAIDFQGLLKSGLTAWRSGAAERVGFARQDLREPLASWCYTRSVAVNRRHVVDKNLALARGAVGGEAQAPEFWLPAGSVSPRLPEGDFLLASPFAGWRSKEWPPERYVELATRAWSERRLPLALDCAPAEAEMVEALAARAPRGAVIAHPSSLAELLGATRRARAVVGVDSGPLHLAAAVGAPGVALFGPTDPARNGPYGSSFRVLRSAVATTSYKRGRDYSAGMRALSVDHVWEALSERLDASRPQFRVVHAAPHPTGVPS